MQITRKDHFRDKARAGRGRKSSLKRLIERRIAKSARSSARAALHIYRNATEAVVTATLARVLKEIRRAEITAKRAARKRLLRYDVE